MKRINRLGAMALPLSIALSACADWDNPTALSELQPEVEFEIGSPKLETFEEVEIHVHVTESGAPLRMRHSQLEIQHAVGGPVRSVELKPEDGGYAAHVTFFEPGEHHLHFMGTPERHQLMWEMGELEVAVQRQHRVIGPYWVELAVSPAPVMEGESAHIHLFAYDLLADGTRGNPVAGLELELEIHNPSGVETAVVVIEEDFGEYEAPFAFDAAGIYELHIEIEVVAEHVGGEFHLPVLAPSDDGDDLGDDSRENAHGH